MKVSYIGPKTNSELALERIKGTIERIPCYDINGVIALLVKGEVQRALIPVRNSIRGEIHDHLARIKESNFRVITEVSLPIHHCFASARKEVGFIMSHAQALAQCEEYLDNRFPAVYREATPSTHFAAQFVAKIGHGAAIAPLETCLHYGLKVIDRDIVRNNVSWFYVCERR